MNLKLQVARGFVTAFLAAGVCLGALAVVTPLYFLVQDFGWRPFIYLCLYIGGGAVVVWIFVEAVVYVSEFHK